MDTTRVDLDNIPDKLYHYTGKENIDNILKKGLDTKSISNQIFTTPNGRLTPLQARIELALPSSRPLPDSVIEIDFAKLKGSDNLPILGPRRIQNMFNAPGGGTEVIFDDKIDPEFLKKVLDESR